MARELLTTDEASPETTPPLAAIPDEIILHSAQEKPALFSILIDRYQAPFLRLAQRVVRDRGDSEDIVQEAFIKIYRYAHRFKKGQDRKFSSWAYKIVLNTAITHYHKAKKREWLLPDPAGSGMDPTADEAHAQFRALVLDRETEAVVHSVLEVMPEELAGLLRAYYLEDKSYQTIAVREGISIGALKMKLFRARKLFKKFLTS
ncbi:MAG: sigma-70 family RNA polymerase sigma factor [Candidatus Sungbacteria bacterium]|uniref:Sigma-70 family RNA polymerase sigma factor n=1 Tax=Candidatus Sungiibacteriota bacterium TaxID=2750080 RepID=A0A932YXB7_9BACT|nr:sigma-70 family RNA polymerase sigma factor [Candidatus Sungbacteria bacterium]